MGKVIQGPWNKEIDEPADIWQTLIYKWWMKEYYPMFEEAGKLKMSYITYGNLIETMMELASEGYVEYELKEEGYQMIMIPEIHIMITEAVNESFNKSKRDEEIND